MLQSNRANQAVESTIAYIEAMRLNDSNYLSRIVFCFPRVKFEESDKWQDASPLVAAATAIVRNPEKAVIQPPPIKIFGPGHKLPSVIVGLNGITAVEYHASRRNLERLLSIGCVVIQKDRKGFSIRIPFNNPMYNGTPHQFEVNSETDVE